LGFCDFLSNQRFDNPIPAQFLPQRRQLQVQHHLTKEFCYAVCQDEQVCRAEDLRSDKRSFGVFGVFVLFDMIPSLLYVRLVMQKKPLRKSKAKPAKRSLPGTQTPSAPSHASAVTEVRVVQLEMPPPDALLREAEEEPNYRDLSEYCPVIATLRGKGFSYREIAEWLSERGVELDHNAVYRLYTRNMSDHEAKMEDQEAQLEGQRNR
jgi:hypothetical protein